MARPTTGKLFLATGDDSIFCGICRNRYRLPRILPCLHTFCSDCISNLQSYPIIEEFDLSHDFETTSDWSITCEHRVENLQRSVDLVRPPAEFDSQDFDRNILPRGRSRVRIKSQRSRSYSGHVTENENTFLRSVRSLHRSNSNCSSRHCSKLSIGALFWTESSSRTFINDFIDPHTPLVASVHKRRIIMCPKCWKEARVSTSLRELPRNLIAERFVIQDACLHPGTVLACGLCNESISDLEGSLDQTLINVTTRCVDCAENLCSICELAHRRQNKTKKHTLIPLEHSRNNCTLSSKYHDTVSDDVASVQEFILSARTWSIKSLTPLELPSLEKFQYLLWDEGSHCRVGSEGEAPRVGSEGEATRVGSEGEATRVGSEGEATRVGSEGEATRVDSEGEATRVDAVDGTICQNDQLILSKGHQTKDTTDVRPVVTCLEHPDQELKMFCVTCEHTVCLDCVLLGHRGHNCQFVTKELFQNQMRDVDRLIQKVIPRVKAVDDQIKSLEQIKVAATEWSTKVRDEVNEFMDTFVEAVERHRKTLLTQVRTMREDKELSLSVTQLQLQQVRSDVEQTCKFLGELLTSASDLEILSMKKLLTHRLTSLKAVSYEPHLKLGGFMRFCPTAEAETFNNFQMYGTVTSAQASAAESRLRGEGLSTSRVARRASMILTVCDNNGTPYNDNDVTIVAWIEFQGQEINVPVTSLVLSDGDHQLEFVPTCEGPHLLHVAVNGGSIKGITASEFKASLRTTVGRVVVNSATVLSAWLVVRGVLQ